MVFDGSGQVVSREEAMAVAEARFTSALDHAQDALSGPRAAEAQDIVDLALVGRARSRLNQGNTTGALADAQAVTPGFVYYATYDASPSRRINMVLRLENGFLVHPRDRDLNIDGVPDPRIPIANIGQHPSTGIGDWLVQRKYASNGTDIPFASWREAQLMIAEIELGQTAVGIINSLRATVDELDHVPPGSYNLPQFASTDDQEILAQVQEERRRELFLQGMKMGDDQRWGTFTEWDTGFSPVNAPIGDLTCLPIPEREFL
jgi:starch-binding outer membrane protein, SusD/RagB family